MFLKLSFYFPRSNSNAEYIQDVFIPCSDPGFKAAVLIVKMFEKGVLMTINSGNI